MANNENPYSIDDTLSTSDNLASLGEVLKALDQALGDALIPHLAGLAAGQSIDKPAIWASLYQATEPPENNVSEDEAGTDGSENAV